MARSSNLEKLAYAELVELRNEVNALIAQKQDEGRAVLKAELAELARQHGFELDEVLGRRGTRQGKGRVAIKYRDTKDPQNTWTGRGRMPRWMTAALKGRGVKKEDFLIE